VSASPFQPILVPLDGSPVAEQALPVAESLARRTGARLRLATAPPPVPPLLLGPEEFDLAQSLQETTRATLGQYLQSAAEAARTRHGLEVRAELLTGGAADALAAYVRTEKIGLIVMTTHGRAGFSRFWLGSVADQLLRRVTAPVLVLHPRESPQPTEFHHVVIALDGTAASEGVLEPAIALGSLTSGVRYTLLQVVEPPIPILTHMASSPTHLGPHWIEKQQIAARNYLDRLAQSLRRRGLSVGTHVLVTRQVGEQIVYLASSLQADLVAVGTHGARGVERLLLGSVADKVVRGAAQAVLVVPVGKG